MTTQAPPSNLPLNPEQLARLQAATTDFTPTQLAWVSGYFWGVLNQQSGAAVAAPAPAAAGAGDVPSPLAGKVVSLDVAPGTAVKAGDQILTLEAMKMNTIIYAPASGTLTAFCVSAGDTVQEGQALAKIG